METSLLLSGTYKHVISNPQWVTSPRNLEELLAFRESWALLDGQLENLDTKGDTLSLITHALQVPFLWRHTEHKTQ